jgi:hypothetical protein
MEDSKPTSDIEIVKKSASEALASVFDAVKKNVDVKGERAAPVFFPQGIDFISLTVKIGDIEVDVTIKGPNSKESESRFANKANAAPPSTSFLDPNEVELNWEGSVKIFGSGFDAGAFAAFDGKVPANEQVTDSLLQVRVTQDITGKRGEKTVIVHNGDGSISNEKKLLVKKR